MGEEGMSIDAALPVSLDTTTQKFADRGFISDTYFFKALGATRVTAIDVSDYEGAEIVHNLDTPIPQHLEVKFDFICNSSVLDNMFNPIMGLTNISKLLAPGGRVIHFEHASNTVNNAYLQFSPNWFFDYYVVNGFADCKTYIALFYDLNGAWKFYAGLHNDRQEPRLFRSSCFAMTLVIAEKAADSTYDRQPIQGQYRSEENWTEYLSSLQRFKESSRSFFVPSNNRFFNWAARIRGFGHQAHAFLRFATRVSQTSHATQKRPGQAILENLMSLLPPGYFAKRRGYRPLGKFY